MRRISINSSLNLHVKPSGPGLWLVGSILISDEISLLLCSNLLFLSVSVLGVDLFPGIYSFLPGCPICWHRGFHNNPFFVIISYKCLYFCGVDYFSFAVVLIWVLFHSLLFDESH